MLQTHSKSTIPSHSCTNWLRPKLCTLKIPILSANLSHHPSFYHNPSNLGTHLHLLRLPSHPIYITLFQNLTHSFIFTLRQYLHPLPKNLTIRAYHLPIFLSSRLSGLQLLRGILTHSLSSAKHQNEYTKQESAQHKNGPHTRPQISIPNGFLLLLLLLHQKVGALESEIRRKRKNKQKSEEFVCGWFD
jgi:hypothetical protein